MATSGTFTGDRGGNQYGPWLTLHWERREVDITNNRSLIRLTLRLHSDYTIRFTANKTGTLHGSSFTYTGGMTSPGTKALRTRDVWVNHNSDGSKSQSFSASFKIDVEWSKKQLTSISVSGTAHITAIPRASTLSAFRFASHLQPNTEVNLNYTIDRKSDAFRHHIQLRDGSYVVQTWDNVSSNGSSSVELSATSVNDLLNRMSSVTSRSFTLRVATRSGVGGGWIGSAVTRNATATVNSNVKPSVGALSLSQTGNTVSSDYLQGKSRITAKLTVSTGYGETISSSSITIRRKGSNDDVQTISGSSGTTSRAVRYSGTYQAQGAVRDSRGRTSYTSWVDFPVTAYSGPRITNFTAVRSSSRPTTVNISRAGAHTHLGGNNILTYTVQRRIGAGSWTNVNTNASGISTSSSFSGTSTSTGNSTTASYEFRMVLTDMFGETAESIVTTSTQRVVLDIHKNEGVGIGKVHEYGVLDVDGPASFGHSDFNITGQVPVVMRMNTTGDQTGVIQGVDTSNNAVWQIGNRMTNSRSLYFEASSAIRMNTSRVNINGYEIIQSGGNSSSGYWVRFYDGTQICWNNVLLLDSKMGYKRGTTLVTSNNMAVNYPSTFISLPAVTVTGNVSGLHASSATANISNNTDYFELRFIGEDYSTQGGRYNYIAIGRWK